MFGISIFLEGGFIEVISRVKMVTALFCCVCLIGGLFLTSPAALADAPQKKKIAVMDFENGYRQLLQTEGITDLFVMELVKNKSFNVMERQRLQDVLKEQRLGTQLSTDGAMKLGKIAGLDYLVYGTVSNIEIGTTKVGLGNAGYQEKRVKVTLIMKFVDAVTGEINFIEEAANTASAKLGAVSGVGGGVVASDSALANQAMKGAVTKLVNKINAVYPIEGVVIDIRGNGNDIYIDLGRDNGVQPKQIYEIYNEGTPIKHPQTGRIMGVEKIKTGEIEITSVVDGGMSIGKKKSGTAAVGSKVRKIK